MSERHFRFLLGIGLWCLLIYSAYYENVIVLYILTGYLLFEGVTNLRITTLTMYFHKIPDTTETIAPQPPSSLINRFEAERALRIIVAILMYSSIALSPDLLWFLPWFIAGMLIMAGITNLCPMLMLLKWAGFK